MKLIYVTAKRFPSKRVGSFCARAMAEALRDRATPFVPSDPRSLAGAILEVRKNHLKAEDRAQKNRGIAEVYTWVRRAQHLAGLMRAIL